MNNSHRAAVLLVSAIALSGCVAKSNHHGYSDSNQSEFQTASNSTGTSFFDGTNQSDNQTNEGNTANEGNVTTDKPTDPKGDTIAPVVQPPVTPPEDNGGETPPVDNGGETPPVDNGGETPPEQPTDPTPPTVTPPTPPQDAIASCEVTPPDQVGSFVRLELHYTLLKGTSFLVAEDSSVEAGDALPIAPIPYELASDATSGDNALQLTDASTIVPGQLLAYRNQGSGFNVVRVASGDSAVSGNVVSLAGVDATQAEAIFETIPAGQNLWNFYRDYVHPNVFGYQAVADYAFNTIAASGADLAGNHVFLGDSWFDDKTLVDRIQERTEQAGVSATIFNEGVGGNTLCNLLDRFDAAVLPNSPKYVWVSSSINDYYNDVTQEEYYDRMKTLIGKIQDAGATAIVFDSAPAQASIFAVDEAQSNGVSLGGRSQRYATQLLNLFNESQ